ncbi:MAG: SDR family oxidoreductase [Phenylobacterium sp.]|nr:SDR family oxidoreductase [Phenylobacterium sp.]
MDLGLSGKVALVAGASDGIGAATARRLSEEGARLALVARPSARLDGVAGALASNGGEAIALGLDLTDKDSAAAAVEATLARYGRLDVMVVSIGAAQGGLFWDIPDETWEAAFALKFMAMVRLLRAAAPVMCERGSGSIVVVVGNNGRQPHPRMLPGSAANAACLAVVKGLADELAPHGVRVNALNPGPTRTARWDRLMGGLAAASGRTPDAEEADQVARIPMRRLNEPDEVARLATLLASDIAPSLTGDGLTCDGGATKGL